MGRLTAGITTQRSSLDVEGGPAIVPVTVEKVPDLPAGRRQACEPTLLGPRTSRRRAPRCRAGAARGRRTGCSSTARRRRCGCCTATRCPRRPRPPLWQASPARWCSTWRRDMGSTRDRAPPHARRLRERRRGASSATRLVAWFVLVGVEGRASRSVTSVTTDVRCLRRKARTLWSIPRVLWSSEEVCMKQCICRRTRAFPGCDRDSAGDGRMLIRASVAFAATFDPQLVISNDNMRALRLDVGEPDPGVPRDAARPAQGPGDSGLRQGHHAEQDEEQLQHHARQGRDAQACVPDHLGGMPGVEDQPQGHARHAAEGAEPSDAYDSRFDHAGSSGWCGVPRAVWSSRAPTRWRRIATPASATRSGTARAARRYGEPRLPRGEGKNGSTIPLFYEGIYPGRSTRSTGMTRTTSPEEPRDLQALRLQPEHRRQEAVRRPVHAVV